MKPILHHKKNVLQISICALLLLASFVGAYSAYVTLNRNDEIRFQNAQKQVIQEIQSRMETYVNALLQTRSMFHVTREVDRKEFTRYVQQMDLLQKYPGVQGVGFTKKITPQGLKAHEFLIQKELPSYKVWPSYPRDQYFSIVYLEPFDWRNQRAIGFDMSTNPVRRAAMEKARDTGLPAMSGAVELVQEVEKDKQTGFLIYVPVYQTDMPTDSVSARRKNLIGYIYSPFRAKDLFGQIMVPLKDLAVDLEVTSTSGISQAVFDRFPDISASESKLQAETFLTLGQQAWRIKIHSLPHFHNRTTTYLSLAIFLLGSLLSVLVTIILFKNSRHARVMEERSEYLDKLNTASKNLISKLDLKDLLQTLTDVGLNLSGASFGAFFYSTTNEKGEALMLYTVSGVPKEEFMKFPMPRNTAVFAPTFGGESMLSPDITKDLRYGKNAPYEGLPKGHLPVRSYLSVAVKSRSGEVIGALFYGHEKAERFTSHELQLIEGLAPQAAIAIDNARLYEEAKKAIATREEFLSIASHELKTPITSMKLQFQAAERMIEMKNNDVFLPGKVEKRVVTAIRQLNRMSKLIDDMLDTSRIALDRFQMHRKPFDLDKLLIETVDRFTEQIKSEGITLDFEVPESKNFTVNGDEYRIEQVISNLIANAIKFGDNGPISISLTQEDHFALLRVEDHGIGIPKEGLPHIFKKYEKVASSSNVGGLGLGLYISKRIVEEHEGDIEVESSAGVGTTFTVKIPLEFQFSERG